MRQEMSKTLDEIEQTINDLYVHRKLFSAAIVHRLLRKVQWMKTLVDQEPPVRTLGQDLRDVERYHALRTTLAALEHEIRDRSDQGHSESTVYWADRIAAILTEPKPEP